MKWKLVHIKNYNIGSGKTMKTDIDLYVLNLLFNMLGKCCIEYRKLSKHKIDMYFLYNGKPMLKLKYRDETVLGCYNDKPSVWDRYTEKQMTYDYKIYPHMDKCFRDIIRSSSISVNDSTDTREFLARLFDVNMFDIEIDGNLACIISNDINRNNTHIILHSNNEMQILYEKLKSSLRDHITPYYRELHNDDNGYDVLLPFYRIHINIQIRTKDKRSDTEVLHTTIIDFMYGNYIPDVPSSRSYSNKYKAVTSELIVKLKRELLTDVIDFLSARDEEYPADHGKLELMKAKLYA